MSQQVIHTHSEYNNFIILGLKMRSFFIFILQLLLIQNSIAQSLDAKTNSLVSCGLTQTNVCSNLENQSGLANINKFVFGIGSKKQFLLNELNNHTIACAIPIYGGVMGLNLNYFGFELYNETKIGLAFGKKLSPSFNIGVQLDYLGTYINENQNNLHNISFEIGIQKQLNRELVLGAHIFNPTIVKLNEDKNIPSLFNIGLRYI